MLLMRVVFDLRHVDIIVNGTSSSGCSSVGYSMDHRSLVVYGSNDADSENESDCATGFGENDDDADNDEFMHQNAPALLCASWNNLIGSVGQEFRGGREELREALSKYSIVNGFEYRFLKNDKKRVTVECSEREAKGCMWRLHASCDTGANFFYIRTYHKEHTCVIGLMHRSSKRMSSSIISKEISEKISKSPLTRPTEVIKEFSRKYACDINYMLAYRGVEQAREEHFGNYKASYDQLRIHMDTAMNSNPGSHRIIDTTDKKLFRRAFIAYHASIEGFNYCRSMIFLDATFLTGKYKGQLLCATAKDGNNSLFPIAIGIVDIEDEDNWTWFMRQLRIILKEEREIVFASDRHIGLLEAVSSVFPGHPHSFCTIHLKNNMKVKMSGKPPEVKLSLLKKFDQVAYSYTKTRFKRKYDELKASAGKCVADWLDTIDPEHYSHAYFPGKRYGEMTSNAAESMNAKYKKLRRLPVIELVDGIRLKLMNDTTLKREKSANWKGVFCPRIEKKIKKAMAIGSTWVVSKAIDHVYEVQAKKSVSVDLSLMTCTCRQWQTNSFPCAHAFAAIHRSGFDLAQFIDPYYHVATNRKVYALPINPIDTLQMPLADPSDLQVLPPQCKRQPGRPKRKRGQGASDDKKRSYQCGRCKGFGHNVKTCKEKTEG